MIVFNNIKKILLESIIKESKALLKKINSLEARTISQRVELGRLRILATSESEQDFYKECRALLESYDKNTQKLFELKDNLDKKQPIYN